MGLALLLVLVVVVVVVSLEVDFLLVLVVIVFVVVVEKLVDESAGNFQARVGAFGGKGCSPIGRTWLEMGR